MKQYWKVGFVIFGEYIIILIFKKNMIVMDDVSMHKLDAIKEKLTIEKHL